MTTAIFRKKNLTLATSAATVLGDEHPMTLRQLYYRLVSAGVLANQQKEYKRLGSVMTRLREAGKVPRSWIVDHVRATLKPSSWSGLADFGDTVRHAYRKDLWASMPHHVEVFVEKDAVAGTLQPVTAEFDVALRVCRGYSSISFAGEAADLWARVEKPIFAYYVGDFDPSGFDLERDLREKLARYSGRCDFDSLGPEDLSYGAEALDRQTFRWERLGVVQDDFEDFDLIALPVKHTDKRAAGFLREHGDDCAEVDALPPTELRRRVREAIESHVDADRWERLRHVEELERQTLQGLVNGWRGEKPNLASVSPDDDDAAGGVDQ